MGFALIMFKAGMLDNLGILEVGCHYYLVG